MVVEIKLELHMRWHPRAPRPPDLEQLVLSGQLFNPSSPTHSPPRTPSPDHGWHDDELDGADDPPSGSPSSFPPNAAGPDADPGVGVGVTGRTGVKGVIRDRAEYQDRERERLQAEAAARKVPQVGGKTYLEEEREKAAAGDARADPLAMGGTTPANAARLDKWGTPRGRFGHLREVGMRGFVDAVEKEAGVWVAVHLYDSSLDRCYALDDSLSKLARAYPDTKFLRAKAAALGFASTSTTAPKRSTTTVIRKTIREEDDDFDDDDEKPSSGGFLGRQEEEDEDEFSDEYDEDSVDTDVLPTLLVYRNGALVHNWVRVDLDAKQERGGIEDLLSRHEIIGTGGTGAPRTNIQRDSTAALDYRVDEEDLVLSEEEK
ncbi:hypothetical protein FB107DRAFT_277517 [Schizophyllum commune]